MNRYLFTLLISLLITNVYAQERRIGVNMSDISNFSSQLPFVDAMKQAAPLRARPEGEEGFADEVEVPIDENGYPLRVPFQRDGRQFLASTIVYNGLPGPWHYPAGDYTLLFEGTGKIIIDWDSDDYCAEDSNVAHTISIENPTSLGLRLTIWESNPDDPITNILLILPGFEDVYEEEHYHPTFIELLRNFETVRFMKPQAIEESTLQRWEDRTRPEHFSYVTDDTGIIRLGIPYEHIIGIANTAGIDPWINIPNQADDFHVEQVARLFAEGLREDLNLHIEYSNESWNLLYPLARQHMIDNGRARNLADHDDELALGVRYHALRSFEIWAIFKDAFGSRAGQIREVLGSQSWVDVGRLTIDAIKDPVINPEGVIPHSIGIASYMGIELIDELVAEFGECNVTEDMILDRQEDIFVHEIAEYMEGEDEGFAFWGDSTGIEIVAYEGGQHLSAGNFQANSDCMAEAIAAANRNPRMRDLLCRYFDLWYDEYNGGLFMAFVLAEGYGVGGSFGFLESTLQDLATSVKWQALVSCVFPDPVIETVSTLEFEATTIGETRTNSFEIRNVGRGDLEIQSITFPEGFSASGWSPGSIAQGSSLEVMVRFEPLQPGLHQGEIVIVSNGGTASIQVQGTGVEDVVTNIDDPSARRSIALYPNPTVKEIYLDLAGINGTVAMAIVDSQGRIIVSEVVTGGAVQKVDVSGFNPGSYYVLLSWAGGTANQRLLILW